MTFALEDTATFRRLQKPVLASRLLDDMERTNRWSHHGQGQMAWTSERARDGQQALRLTSPTKPERPAKITGRPFGEAVARFNVPGEDWTEFNRLSFWVWPHLPGFKVISMLVRLRNDGAVQVPDAYGREGLHYFLLRPDQWNHVVWEIPHLARDRVTAVEFVYRLQGHEPGATGVVCFDLDQLEIQRVEPDQFEGWSVAPGRLAYCHSGYRPASRKVALASGLAASQFSLVSRQTGAAVLTKPVSRIQTELGEFAVLDFSELTAPGQYRIEAGSVQSRWFPITEQPWLPSVWKTLNSFYCQRCGDAVPGIHDVCHRDWQAQHGQQVLVINGGWHDAGDLSQGVVNTAEAAEAMLALAEELAQAQPGAELRQLIDQLRAEARWGVAWLLKTRFGDGYRVSWATMDYWTDGQVGTADDTWGQVRNSPFDNFLAAATQARAARVWAGSDPAWASNCLSAARADWQVAVDRLSSPNLEVAAAGVLASVELFKATGESTYAGQAVQLAEVILASQQQEWTDWTIRLAGFFYTSPKRDRLLHYSHRSHEQAPIVALAQLCELFPHHTNWMRWYAAVALHADYLKRIAQCTEPWGMLPAGVYSIQESADPQFQEQVRQGVRLSETHYLRRFPVWFQFRGNCGTILSQAKALSAAARLRRDMAGFDLVQRQLEWTIGRNPFCQSLMFGEGHDYAPQYSAMSGDLVGGLPVGIQTRLHWDQPYWPAATCYNYAEVWVHPSTRWLAIMADLWAASAPPAPVDIADAQAAQHDEQLTITATLRGQGRHPVTLRASNLSVQTPTQTAELSPDSPVTLRWAARLQSARAPWVAVVVCETHPTVRREVVRRQGD